MIAGPVPDEDINKHGQDRITISENDILNGIVLAVREKHLRLSVWCSDSKQT